MKNQLQHLKKQDQKGFTLLETLIALFIMGVTTATILVLIGQNTRFTGFAEERVFASIIADNVVVETLATPTILERGLTQGEVSMGGRRWVYERTIDDSSLAGIVTINVRVRRENSPQIQAEIVTLKSEQP